MPMQMEADENGGGENLDLQKSYERFKKDQFKEDSHKIKITQDRKMPHVNRNMVKDLWKERAKKFQNWNRV